MAYVLGSLHPWEFRALLRREFTTDLKRHHGEYINCIVHAVTCKIGSSLWFHVTCLEPFGGATWHVPITAIVDKPCPMPEDMTYLQPWDCMGERFSIEELAFLKKLAVDIRPDGVKGQYITSIAFADSFYANDSQQNKTLHLCRLANGHIGAFPSNRVLWTENGLWEVMKGKPDFESLHYEARAEGNQQHLARWQEFRAEGASNIQKTYVAPSPAPLNGLHSDPKERPDWHA